MLGSPGGPGALHGGMLPLQAVASLRGLRNEFPAHWPNRRLPQADFDRYLSVLEKAVSCLFGRKGTQVLAAALTGDLHL